MKYLLKVEVYQSYYCTPLGLGDTANSLFLSACLNLLVANHTFSALYFSVCFIFSRQITRSGRILSEKEYKLNIMKRDHQKYIRECLAQAIFHKVLDMEVEVFTIFFITDMF